MDKKKKIESPHKSDLYAVLQIPLDLAYDALIRYENPDAFIASERIDEDTILINIFPKRHLFGIKVIVYGTLRRWQGNLTQIQFNSKVDIAGEWTEWLASLLPFVGAVGCVYLFLLGGSSIAALFTGNVPFQLLLVLAIAVAIIAHPRLPVVEIFKAKRFDAVSMVNDMMQLVANALSEASNKNFYEYDGSEDALSQLLTQHDFGHLQMNSDGELA